MGKKSKKDNAKKEEKKKRQEAKAMKAAKKRSGKEAKAAGEEDIDSILAEIMAKEAQKTAITVTPCEQPSPRSNFTMTALPSGEMLLFGGEYFDGSTNVCYNELFRWNIEANTWQQIESPNTPPPRCAHQAALYRDFVYVFGGEFATTEQFYHYRDLWRLDTKTNRWESLELKGKAPTARSGHRMIVWRNYLVLFGGFYEAFRDTRWFGDLFLMNFQDLTWQKMDFPSYMMVPAPRSGCQLGVHLATDVVFIYGGYSKVKEQGSKGEAKIHTDMWAINLKPVVGGGKPTIDKVSRKGKYPTPRSGASMTVHKNRAILFGGVFDKEGPQHTMESEFYNDLYAFDMDRRVWYNLKLKAKKKPGQRRRKKKNKDNTDDENEGQEDFALTDSEDDESDTEEVNEQAEEFKENAFGYIDESGKMVYVEDEEGNTSQAETQHESQDPPQTDSENMIKSNPSQDDAQVSEGSNNLNAEPVKMEDVSVTLSEPPPPSDPGEESERGNTQQPAQAEEEEEEKKPTPLPRINPCLMMRGPKLYIYGGMLEMGDREVTLDDFWSLDLNQREEWFCIAEGTMHLQVWKGDDDETTDGDEDGEEGDSEDYEDESDLEEELYGVSSKVQDLSVEDQNLESKEPEGEDTDTKKKKKKKDKKKSKRKGLREEIRELQAQLDLNDTNTTPQAGESLRDFYARTTEYWAQELIRLGQEKAQEAQAAENESTEEAPQPEVSQAVTDTSHEEDTCTEKKTIYWEEVPKMREKELRKTAFILAEDRFNELKPLLERLNALEEEQKQEELRHAKDKKGKRDSKSRR